MSLTLVSEEYHTSLKKKSNNTVNERMKHRGRKEKTEEEKGRHKGKETQMLKQ